MKSKELSLCFSSSLFCLRFCGWIPSDSSLSVKQSPSRSAGGNSFGSKALFVLIRRQDGGHKIGAFWLGFCSNMQPASASKTHWVPLMKFAVNVKVPSVTCVVIIVPIQMVLFSLKRFLRIHWPQASSSKECETHMLKKNCALYFYAKYINRS